METEKAGEEAGERRGEAEGEAEDEAEDDEDAILGLEGLRDRAGFGFEQVELERGTAAEEASSESWSEEPVLRRPLREEGRRWLLSVWAREMPGGCSRREGSGAAPAAAMRAWKGTESPAMKLLALWDLMALREAEEGTAFRAAVVVEEEEEEEGFLTRRALERNWYHASRSFSNARICGGVSGGSCDWIADSSLAACRYFFPADASCPSAAAASVAASSAF